MRQTMHMLWTWNNKYLDYEIETTKWGLWLLAAICLKQQVPRLRDWNASQSGSSVSGHAHLKQQVPRLRDWNTICILFHDDLKDNLKQQVPRLRDWNKPHPSVDAFVCFAWNNKYLDYEIETTSTSTAVNSSACLTWNNKYLDYEIETRRITIGRNSRAATWNNKYLDYEIETKVFISTRRDWTNAWNNKYLDYEIETTLEQIRKLRRRKLETTSTSITRLKLDNAIRFRAVIIDLKQQVPRLRDWNKHGNHRNTCGNRDLKQQVPRLRDWNEEGADVASAAAIALETTSTSITRLKQYFHTCWHFRCILETTSTSITRLKPYRETRQVQWWMGVQLETTSTSITRLKPYRRLPRHKSRRALKQQVPRLRDWNMIDASSAATPVNLKQQVPRLRDWNAAWNSTAAESDCLETTSTSITRLKLWNRAS